MLKRFATAIGLCLILVIASCTDLTETVNSEVTPDNFFQNEQQFVAALGDAYVILGDGGDGDGGTGGFGSHNGYVSIQEVSSDEVILPHRGPDWEDGGQWIRMHRHQFRFDEVSINGAWIQLFRGVNSSNRLIQQFQDLIAEGSVDEALARSFIAELAVLRSYYYLQLLDAFGNVPILRSFAETPADPPNNTNFQAGRTELFNFIETTVLDNIDALSEDTGATYGRVNKWVAHMILAKLYLNAEVYTGTARWNDVITQTDAIINSGNYNLATDYRSNFITANENSPETIFAIPYDIVFLKQFNLNVMSLHYQMQATVQMTTQPWNGYASMQEFYESYTDPNANPGPQGPVIGADGTETTGTQDRRLVNFFVGEQTDAQGVPIEDPSFAVTNDPGDPDNDPGPVVVLTPFIDELAPNANRQAGVRIHKYEIAPGTGQDLDNDFIIYRYADVLMMQAEAICRLEDPTLNSCTDATALMHVNDIRSRADVDPFSEITAENLLAERGREFFYEIFRRQDLIRFDGVNGGDTRFNDPWKFKNVSNQNVNVFPIPKDQLEANDNLTQNPGFSDS